MLLLTNFVPLLPKIPSQTKVRNLGSVQKTNPKGTGRNTKNRQGPGNSKQSPTENTKQHNEPDEPYGLNHGREGNKDTGVTN